MVVLASCARKFNEEDRRGPLLFHTELGLGLPLRDRARGIEYPTLPRYAIDLKLSRELRAEQMRLLYVGMTRATEKLILTAAVPSVEQSRKKWRGVGLTPQQVAEGRSFADWFFLTETAAPGEIRWRYRVTARNGDGFLGLEAPETPWEAAQMQGEATGCSVDQERPASTQDDAETADTLCRGMLGFVYPHKRAAQIPSKVTVTQLKGRRLEAEVIEDTPLSFPHRPPPAFGLRLTQDPLERGTATHLLMQHISLAAHTAESVSAELERLVLGCLLTPEQAKAIDVSQVTAFFQSELGRRLASSKYVRREMKFSQLVPVNELYEERQEDGEILLQGVMDCFFLEGEKAVLIDYKTDHRIPGGLPALVSRYETQMRLYTRVLTRLTGRPVESFLYAFAYGEAARC